jgi:hypothetical protein
MAYYQENNQTNRHTEHADVDRRKAEPLVGRYVDISIVVLFFNVYSLESRDISVAFSLCLTMSINFHLRHCFILYHCEICHQSQNQYKSCLKGLEIIYEVESVSCSRNS